MPTYRTWIRYAAAKTRAAVDSAVRSYEDGSIKPEEIFRNATRNLFLGHLTFLHSYKGKEMVPTFPCDGATLLVRPCLGLTERQVNVGDIVLLKSPKDAEKLLVRRVAAKEGEQILSTNSKDKPFHLERGYFWLLSDNEKLTIEDAVDSRIFGPVESNSILGRAIYFYVSQENHGVVQNSPTALKLDNPLLEAELDIERLNKPP